MGKRSAQLGLSVIIGFSSLIFSMQAGAAGKTTVPAEIDLSGCEWLLTGQSQMGRYVSLTESYSLLDLLTQDPEKNLAARFPTMLMNNDQLDYYVANKYPRFKIKDPAYRLNSYWYYPLISAGVKEAEGRQIVGHYETIQRALDYIDARAKGKRAAKMLGFVGPAGTGKTEIGILLEIAKRNLAMTDPAYYQFTFEFINLDQIPELKPLTYGTSPGESNPNIRDISLNRSPLVLLPPEVQKQIVELATPAYHAAVSEKSLTMDPQPFLTPSNKTQRVIDAIISYRASQAKTTQITPADYLKWLAPHVRIVRRTFDTNQPPPIIRYLGKHPDMSTLFFTENMAMSQFYGPKDPLSYSYGLIPSNDGKGIFVDEMFRQTGEVRDTFLDLAQNSVAQNGGAPPETLNTTIYFATNDESITQAQEDGGAKAHLNRTLRLPVRHAIEPWQTVKIALNDIGRKGFVMRPLGTTEPQETIPYDPQVAIPDSPGGEVIGTDGRFAIYAKPGSKDTTILIAPRALWYIGLVGAGTRLVTDPKIFKKTQEGGTVEFSTLAKYPQYFLDPKERLHVLNGTKQVERVVASELKKVRDFLQEGQLGIGAREIENWISEAVAMAKNSGGTVTPVIVDQAFVKLLDNGGITSTPKERTAWIQLSKMIKAEFILPALSADVLSILQGQGRAERLYDEVKNEILTLSKDRDSQYIEGEGNNRTPIDKNRLNEIYGYFQQISGTSFDPGLLKDFHLQVNSEASMSQRHPALLEAVRRYMFQREMDKTTITELVQYFDGKSVPEDVRNRGLQAEAQLVAQGYDRNSFIQALIFVRDQQFIIERERQKPGPR